MIRLSHVEKWFGTVHVLNDVSLDVVRGGVVVIAGPSGAGKSTLIRAVNRLESIQSGEIFVDGVSVHDLRTDINRLRQGIGMVFQHFNLFPHLTILDNVTLGPRQVKRQTRAEAEQLGMSLLTRVGIPEQARKYPGQLSGGQQQRVAIARALAMRPKVMLFDEPTSALDPEMIKEVLDVMIDLAHDDQITMLVVTHEMSFARQVSSLIAFMDQGAIVELAPPGEFFSNPREERSRAFLSKILAH